MGMALFGTALPAGQKHKTLIGRKRAALQACARAAVWLITVTASAGAALAQTIDEPAELGERFTREVHVRLPVPQDEQRAYGRRIEAALARAQADSATPQYVLLVDRNALVQAAFIYRVGADGIAQFVGAAPVSTGKPGEYDHFYTPLGVFPHEPSNMDYRAEGTKNAKGVRGYGATGMRVYDFGWVESDRGWGPPAKSTMRLQVHATDPELLERTLGRARSQGCIRIPASLNTFIDRYGLLDADYEAAVKQGRVIPVLRDNREPVPSAGRYLIVVDTQRTARPEWVRAPGAPHASKKREPPVHPVKRFLTDLDQSTRAAGDSVVKVFDRTKRQLEAGARPARKQSAGN
jgi:lipoprotein-anchoring transpeptidase ErfK/SrfK